MNEWVQHKYRSGAISETGLTKAGHTGGLWATVYHGCPVSHIIHRKTGKPCQKVVRSKKATMNIATPQNQYDCNEPPHVYWCILWLHYMVTTNLKPLITTSRGLGLSIHCIQGAEGVSVPFSQHKKSSFDIPARREGASCSRQPGINSQTHGDLGRFIER